MPSKSFQTTGIPRAFGCFAKMWWISCPTRDSLPKRSLSSLLHGELHSFFYFTTKCQHARTHIHNHREKYTETGWRNFYRKCHKLIVSREVWQTNLTLCLHSGRMIFIRIHNINCAKSQGTMVLSPSYTRANIFKEKSH